MKLTPAYISHIFKSDTGENIKSYITNVRLKKATWMISATDLTIETIAAGVGYDSARSFYREALLYEWTEEYEPALFRYIQRLAAEGRWNIIGGYGTLKGQAVKELEKIIGEHADRENMLIL